MSLNRVCITGNLTKHPELRTTSSGMSILTLRVAVNDRRKNDAGEWVDTPNYFEVTVFGARGESLSRFLSKGGKVAVEGKLRWREWATQDGQKRESVSIIADDIEFMSRRDEGAATQQSVDDTEIPFHHTTREAESMSRNGHVRFEVW